MATVPGLTIDTIRRADISEELISAAAELEFMTKSLFYTVKIDGKYKRKNLSGGEQMFFQDCYDGKKQGLICVFEVSDAAMHAKADATRLPENIIVEVPLKLCAAGAHVMGGGPLVELLLTGKCAAPVKSQEYSDVDELLEEEVDEDLAKRYGSFG